MRSLSSEDFRMAGNDRVLCRVYRDLDESNRTKGFSWEIRSLQQDHIFASGQETGQRRAWNAISDHIRRFRKEWKAK